MVVNLAAAGWWWGRRVATWRGRTSRTPAVAAGPIPSAGGADLRRWWPPAARLDQAIDADPHGHFTTDRLLTRARTHPSRPTDTDIQTYTMFTRVVLLLAMIAGASAFTPSVGPSKAASW